MSPMLQFVYLAAFERARRGLLSEKQCQDMEKMLLADPEAGDPMSGTGGVRKLRMPLEGRGKSGGARVIYYYRARDGRIYLLFAFPKNEAANLSRAGRNQMKQLTAQLEEES